MIRLEKYGYVYLWPQEGVLAPRFVHGLDVPGVKDGEWSDVLQEVLPVLCELLEFVMHSCVRTWRRKD